MTLIFKRESATPVTHAFVVGCGRYPHLRADHLADRKAPVAGALAFAKMLLESRDKLVAPLGSLELLLSDPAVAAGIVDISGKLGAVLTDLIEPADERHFRDRGEQWLDGIRQGDAVIFYFSGHGIADQHGGAVGLLEDIGSKQMRPWSQSFNAYNLLMALQTSASSLSTIAT